MSLCYQKGVAGRAEPLLLAMIYELANDPNKMTHRRLNDSTTGKSNY